MRKAIEETSTKTCKPDEIKLRKFDFMILRKPLQMKSMQMKCNQNNEKQYFY